MQPDPDRFRPREPGPVSEQSPPTEGDSARTRPVQPHRYAPPQYGAPQQYNDPRPGSAGIGASHAAPRAVPGYAPPHPGTRFAPALDGRDAPLIHPAAAQASNVTPYGVPVYRTPVYADAPQPHRGLSITALVLGLCSFLFAWTLVVVPLIGIVFGFVALRREPAGKAMAIIGLVASVIGLVWVLLFYMLPLFGVLRSMLFTFNG
jgi:Domain of unknown function (DUF4190)